MTGALLGSIFVLSVLLIFALVHSRWAEEPEQVEAASRRQVLRELARIEEHSPEMIVRWPDEEGIPQ